MFSLEIDLIPYSLTFFCGLFVSVEIGIIAGTIAHLLILVYFSSKPKVTITEERYDNVPYTLVVPDRALFFPSVDEIRTYLAEAANKGRQKNDEESGSNVEPNPVIVDMSKVVDMDYTAAAVSKNIFI